MNAPVTQARIDPDRLLLNLQRDVEEAQQRRDAQIALIASLAGQEKEQAEAQQQLRMIEMTILQAQENYALVKFLAEPE